MPSKGALEGAIEQLGLSMLDSKDVKAVMMSKDDYGNIAITLVQGIDRSHKVRFGSIERCSRTLVRATGAGA
jgi:hypothetical protein